MFAEPEFWVVWNPQHGVPVVRHYTRQQAVGEAKRLATNNPGQNFYVLAARARVWAQEPVQIVTIGDEVPF